jgi:hypothetical protein
VKTFFKKLGNSLVESIGWIGAVGWFIAMYLMAGFVGLYIFVWLDAFAWTWLALTIGGLMSFAMMFTAVLTMDFAEQLYTKTSAAMKARVATMRGDMHAQPAASAI